MNATTRLTEIQAGDWLRWGARLPSLHDKAAFWSVEWLEAWVDSFLPYDGWSGPVRGWAVSAGTRTLGILPMAYQQVGPLRVLSLAGPYGPYRTLVSTADAGERHKFSSMLAHRFRRHPPSRVLRFGPVLASDPGVRSLVDALLDSGWQGISTTCGPAMTLEIPSSEDDLLRQASSSLLKNVAYLRRRLGNDVGEVTITRHVLCKDSAAVLHTVAEIEARSWVAKTGGETKFVGPSATAFWERMSQRGAGDAEVVLWLLHAGSTAVSFSVHVESARTVHIIANGYDDQWKAFSPGSILSHAVLLDACRRGRCWLNWGQGDSGYKKRWGARDADRFIDIMLFHPGIVGGVLGRLARWRLPEWQPLTSKSLQLPD